MKIRYIEPKPRGATIYEIANLPKLGLPLLAAIARNTYDDVDQHIYCELIRGVEIDWTEGGDRRADRFDALVLGCPLFAATAAGWVPVEGTQPDVP